DCDSLGLHVRIGIVHDHAKILQVLTNVPSHFTVMKSVEVDAFPIDVLKSIPRVNASIGIAGRIDAYRHGIYLRFGISNSLAAIALHSHVSRMADLDSVPADGIEMVSLDPAAGVPRGSVERVSPDPVPANMV